MMARPPLLVPCYVPHLLLDTGALKTTGGKAEVPSLDKEGWLRPLRKCREACLAGADGVVGSSHRLSEVDEPPRPRLQRNGTIYLMARRPLLCQGGDFAFPAGCPRRPCSADDLWVTLSPCARRGISTKKGRLGNLSTRPFSVFVACRLSTMRELDLHKIGLFV